MNTPINQGIVAFVIWSVFSTWYYVNYIREIDEVDEIAIETTGKHNSGEPGVPFQDHFQPLKQVEAARVLVIKKAWNWRTARLC